MFSSAFLKPFYYLIVGLIVITMFVCCFFIPTFSEDYLEFLSSYTIQISNEGYAWPAPGYTKINSYFGKRTSPTAGASSYHKGVDIGAPEGAYFIAIADGTITYVGFLGGGGYTITLTLENNLKITYCHVSPQFIVEENQKVKMGDVIGRVGPKYVYGVKGNNYTDENGKPTNGATTGPHLHLGVRDEDNNYIDPLELFSNIV